MLTLIVTEKGGTPKRMDFDKDEVTVGRVPGNDIVLNKGNVSKRHSRVVKQDGRFFVVDLKSTNGTYLNGRRITTPSVIRPGDKVYIGDFVIMVDMGDGAAMEMAAQDMGDMPMEGGPNEADANDGQDDGGYDEMPAPEPQGPPPGFAPPPMGPSRSTAMTNPGPGGPGGPQPIGARGPMQPPQGPPRPMSSPGAPMSGPPGPMGGPNLGGPPGPMGGPPGPMGGPPGPMGGPNLGGPPGPMGGPNLGGPPGPMGGPNLGGPPGPMGGPPGPMGGPNLGGPPRPVALPPNGPLGGGPPGPMQGGPMPGGPMQGGPSPLSAPPGPRPLAPPPGGPGPMPGGPMPGGPMPGGPMPGGPMQGGPMPGGPMQGGPMPGGPMPGGPMPGGPMPGGPMPGGPMQGGPGSAMRSSGPGLAPMNRPPISSPGQDDRASGPMSGPQLVPVSLGAPPGMDMGAPDAQREAIPSLETYGTGEPQQTPPLGVQRAHAPPMDAPPMPAPMAPLAPPPGPAPMPSPAAAQPRPLAPTPMVQPAPMPQPAPSAPRVAQAVAEARSGNEYADALAQVVRVAKQRGVEAAYGDDAARQRARSLVEQAARSLTQLPAVASYERLAGDALAELVGFGAFEAVLEDGAIEAASVDHQGRVTTLRGGAYTAGSHWFSSPSAVVESAERLLRAHGIDRAGRPSVHAALADGTRVLALFPPLVHGGAVVQLERHARPTTLSDLTARGLLSPQALNVLVNALASRRNIIVAGARGSGRTALLSALLASLPHDDRTVVIEDRDELSRARHDALSVRAEGDWSAAVSAALSLRAGRVVYGEATEACAKAFVAGLTTGVEGAMIAVAAPTGPIALARLASTATHDKWLTQQDAAARILAARPLLIETARLGDGQCRVVGVGEVRPGNDGSLQVAPMFSLRIDGADSAGNIALQLVPAGAY